MNGDDLTLTVVIPTKGQGHYLDDALRSIAGNAPARVLVVDGGSHDASEAVARAWSAGWICEPDDGACHAMWKGLRQATTDLVAIQMASDGYRPGVGAHVRRAFADDPALVYLAGQATDGGGPTVEPAQNAAPRDLTWADLRRYQRDVLPVGWIQAAFFRTAAVRDLPRPWTETCHTAWLCPWLCAQLAAGRRAAVTSSVWAWFRRHPDANQAPYVHYWAHRARVWHAMTAEYPDLEGVAHA